MWQRQLILFFSGANWWKLRKKFKSAFPKGVITEEYLASVLGMQIASVKNNGILSNLRALGLLDDENKCTDLANRWRLDDTYAAACEEMLLSLSLLALYCYWRLSL